MKVDPTDLERAEDALRSAELLVQMRRVLGEHQMLIMRSAAARRPGLHQALCEQRDALEALIVAWGQPALLPQHQQTSG